ncbi:MAG: cob(I)yrinic acid a,c-diamide adenosyltransferase [Patescibacteria group bacterium]
MLYTRKGDDGATQTFGCDQRISKSSAVAEALGTLDELNSFFGICKVKSAGLPLSVESQYKTFGDLVHFVQENLFIVQAQVAGTSKVMDDAKIKIMEEIVDGVEKVLPPISTFFIAGGDELSATFDFARTIARRAERRVITVSDEGLSKISPETLSFMNRLSSLLYALARLSNAKSGITEESPKYK